MRALLLSFLSLVFGQSLYGDAPPNYYDATAGKSGSDLGQALHLIIKGHRVIAYSGGLTNTGTALKVLDEDPANTNNVICIYARKSVPKSALGASDGWNREHLWCNSYGLDNRLPAYSDLHNLRPEDSNVNSARGNKFYDESDPKDSKYRSPAHAEAPLATTDADSWEPPAEVRGDIARAAFYMSVRYTGDLTNEPSLFLTDQTTQISTTTNRMGRLSTLLRWHQADPVDNSERRRNDLIFSQYQYNRNPFIDRPEWVREVFAPRLEIALRGDQIELTWPGHFQNALVESSHSAQGPWEGIIHQPTLINGVWALTLALTDTMFFRLRLR